MRILDIKFPRFLIQIKDLKSDVKMFISDTLDVQMFSIKKERHENIKVNFIKVVQRAFIPLKCSTLLVFHRLKLTVKGITRW